MLGAWLIPVVVLHALGWTKSWPPQLSQVYTSVIMGGGNTCMVVTDLTITFMPADEDPSTKKWDRTTWHRIEKDLYVGSGHQTAWLEVALAAEDFITPDDLIITDVTIDEAAPSSVWEERLGGMWLLRNKYFSNHDQVLTAVDALFGADAIDPRPQWSLVQQPLRLDGPSEVPTARLTVRRGRPKPRSLRTTLRARADGTFKIVQISDTHMRAGVGACNDALGPGGQCLPVMEADPLTMEFVGRVLDVEKPDLVILTGDQLHHDILDSKSALFKVVAPMIERSIPFAAVFGNHDSEGTDALSREAQMSLLQDLPFSFCEAGLKTVDGVGNFYIQIFGHDPSSHLPLSTLFLLDSHGEIESRVRKPDYEAIKQSQIDWFTRISQATRKGNDNQLTMVFFHIPLPEFGDSNIVIKGGLRREPTEGPSFNSHFYDALVKEGVAVVSCGHDHVNDFCGLLPQAERNGPWLCYGGTSGFGGYCSYDGVRYHRRCRVWEIDTSMGGIRTWKRVEYAEERVDEEVIVEGGVVVLPQNQALSRIN